MSRLARVSVRVSALAATLSNLGLEYPLARRGAEEFCPMAIYRVDNQSELNSAIQKARGGDSILLAAGRYDKLELNSSMSAMKHVKFASSVTIASADKSRPAIVEALNVNGAANTGLH